MMYLGTVFCCVVELAVGTMYLVRRGWVFMYVSEWGLDPRTTLGKQDSNLQHKVGIRLSLCHDIDGNRQMGRGRVFY